MICDNSGLEWAAQGLATTVGAAIEWIVWRGRARHALKAATVATGR